MNHILICKDEMIKQLKENIRTYLCDFGMGKNFLNGTKTALTIKENIDKLTTSKLETSTFKKSVNHYLLGFTLYQLATVLKNQPTVGVKTICNRTKWVPLQLHTK